MEQEANLKYRFGKLKCVRKGSTQRRSFADLRWAGFSSQMLVRSTELSVATKLSAEHETPPIANVLLCAG